MSTARVRTEQIDQRPWVGQHEHGPVLDVVGLFFHPVAAAEDFGQRPGRRGFGIVGLPVDVPAECFDGRPFQVGIGERRDQRLDRARIFQSAECVGGSDANPPIGIFQQLERRGNDARIIERCRDGNRRGAHIWIRIGKQLDGGLHQRVAEDTHRFERAIADEARERFRIIDVALDDGGGISHADQDLHHRRTRSGVARCDQRQKFVDDLGAARRCSFRQCIDE